MQLLKTILLFPIFPFISFNLDSLNSLNPIRPSLNAITLLILLPLWILNIWAPETDIYYNYSNEASQSFPSECSTIQLPLHLSNRDELKITAEFYLEVHVFDACSSCYSRGGLCELDNKGKFHCSIIEKGIDIGITQKKRKGPTVTHIYWKCL